MHQPDVEEAMKATKPSSQGPTSVETYRAVLWMAGDIATAKRVLREHCYVEGLCITVTPTTFIYTGGEEAGFAIGLVNYPRFPESSSMLLGRAKALARKLVVACSQVSCLIVADDVTCWVVIEPPGAR